MSLCVCVYVCVCAPARASYVFHQLKAAASTARWNRSTWKSDGQIQASCVRQKCADGLKISRCVMEGRKENQVWRGRKRRRNKWLERGSVRSSDRRSSVDIHTQEV